MSVSERIKELRTELPQGVTLVAVSKTHPAAMVKEAYDAGQRIFGENRPQEMTAKYNELPKDIAWHFIGTLQTNKVKYIAPYVALIHSVDSEKLLQVISKEAVKNGRVLEVLLEVHVAQEETKSGWDANELEAYLDAGYFRDLPNVKFRGIMGMATYTEDVLQIKKEFTTLRKLFDTFRERFFAGNEGFDTLSMGMTGDYKEAIACGSTMVRIGSYIFGERDYSQPIG